MAFSLSANQYNDSFRPRCLGVWDYGVNHPNIQPRTRRGCTKIIADDNGHLLPGVQRDPSSSPWGDYRTWIWEEPTFKGDFVDRIKHPQDYDRPPCSIVVTRARPRPVSEAGAVSKALAQQLFRTQTNPVQVTSVKRGC